MTRTKVVSYTNMRQWNVFTKMLLPAVILMLLNACGVSQRSSLAVRLSDRVPTKFSEREKRIFRNFRNPSKNETKIDRVSIAIKVRSVFLFDHKQVTKSMVREALGVPLETYTFKGEEHWGYYVYKKGRETDVLTFHWRDEILSDVVLGVLEK